MGYNIALGVVVCILATMLILNEIKNKYIEESFDEIVIQNNQKILRDETIYKLNQIMEKNDGRLVNLFDLMGINSVAIYGYGKSGKMLCDYLIKEGITVDYLIDRCAQNESIRMFRIEDDLPKTDAIIVSLSFGYLEVVDLIKRKEIGRVLLLDNLLDEI